MKDIVKLFQHKLDHEAVILSERTLQGRMQRRMTASSSNNYHHFTKNSLKTLLFLSLILLRGSILADDNVPDYSSNLTGDWAGKRTKLYNDGIDVSLNYHADFFSNVKGGIKRGSGILSEADLKLKLDGEKLLGIEGSKAFFEFLSIPGARPNQKYVGSLVQLNSNEPTASMTRLEQAWISKDLVNGKVNILTGLYDINTDFYVTNSASVFLQPSFGIGDEVAQTFTNNNKLYGASTFPTRSTGVRVKFTPNDNFYFQTAIMDALLQGGGNVNTASLRISKNDGRMIIAEAGTSSKYGNYSIGAWGYNKIFPDLLNPQILRKNQGYYLMGEKSLYKKDARELFLFVRYGVADKRAVQIDQMSSIGVTLNGVFKGRDDSQLGFGISRAHISNNYVQAAINNGQNTLSSETSFELTYNDKILPWLQVQPDLQYIPRPTLSPVNAGSPYLKDATIFTLRVGISF